MDEELYHIFLVARNIVAPWRELCLKLVPWRRLEPPPHIYHVCVCVWWSVGGWIVRYLGKVVSTFIHMVS